MRTFRNLTTFVVLSATLAGCGGSSGTNTIPSLYAGSWSGTWVGPLANDGGAVTMTVTSDGSVTGTIARSTGVSGSLSGVINGTGHMTATAGFPSDGNFLMNGSVLLSSGALTGGFNYQWLGSNYTGTFTLTNSSSGGSSTGG